MRDQKRNARPVAAGPGEKGFNPERLRQQYSTAGRYAWRRDRGLLTLSDHVRRYLAVRHPRGPYWVPMPGDLIGREVGP